MVLLLLLVIAVKQLLWSAFVPMWHFPDEQAHFAQVQNYIEKNPINPARGNTTSEEIYQSEILLDTVRDEAGNNKFTYHPEYTIPYSSTSVGIHEDTIREFTPDMRTEVVINEATAYPPLYYRIAGVGYQLNAGQDLFARVFTTRIVNIAFFVATVYATYRIGRVLFGRNRLLAITLAMLVGFHPMLSFVGAGVNSDNAFNLLFTLGIYSSLMVIKKGMKRQYIIAMAVILLLSLYTKPQARLLPLLYVFPLLYSVVQCKRARKTALVLIGLSVIAAFGFSVHKLIIGAQILPNVTIDPQQLAMSELTFLQHMTDSLRQTIVQTVPWYWGVFRWLSLTLPREVNRIINRVLLLAAVGLAIQVFVWVRRLFKDRKLSAEFVEVSFLLYAAAVYFFAIIGFDYLFIRTHGFSFGVQGRYFFPTIAAHMTILLIGLYALAPLQRIKTALVAISGVGMMAVHAVAFWTVVTSYYSTANTDIFFLQASQYKPAVFKTPFLEGLVVLFVISNVTLVWYYLRIGIRYAKKT